jgi:hypothetical protein
MTKSEKNTPLAPQAKTDISLLINIVSIFKSSFSFITPVFK